MFCPLPIYSSLFSMPPVLPNLMFLFLYISFVTIQSLLSVPQLLLQANFPSWIERSSFSTPHLRVSKQGPQLEAGRSEGCGQRLHTCFSSMQQERSLERDVLCQLCMLSRLWCFSASYDECRAWLGSKHSDLNKHNVKGRSRCLGKGIVAVMQVSDCV